MKLPEIFKNKLNDNINNNERIFVESSSHKDNEEFLDKLPVKVKIKTIDDKEIITTIVGKTKNYLITKNRDVFYINDLKDIKKA